MICEKGRGPAVIDPSDFITFIGGGAMGTAIIKGLCKSGLVAAEKIRVGAHRDERAKELTEAFGVQAFTDNKKAVEGASVVILAIKPQKIEEVLTQDFLDSLPQNAAIISIMGSVDLARLEAIFPGRKILRAMPNTPLAIGQGMTAIAAGSLADDELLETGKAVFDACGKTFIVDEKDIEAVTAVSGCGPGYVYVLIDALADAGVMAGLPRKMAIELAAQTFAGAGSMVLETGEHPAVLRDMVTSPGGTTIAGIHALEEHGVRAAMYGAVEAVLKRSEELKR